jgi:uncharacterized membrane protein
MATERRYEVSRLEAFSDAAFAFALTLLVVSLDVPKSYEQLVQTMRGFPSFACCFALLVWVWHEHNLFFRRYGLQDAWTVFVNSMLLFVTLFYVYPLKFMFDSMFAQFSPQAYPALTRMSLPQLANASAIYGMGFFILFALFALLYRHAYNKRDSLGLTTVEAFDARAYLGHHVLSASVGLVAVGIALLGPLSYAPLSPMAFGLMGPAHWWFGTRTDRRRRLLSGDVVTPRAARAD